VDDKDDVGDVLHVVVEATVVVASADDNSITIQHNCHANGVLQ